MKIYITDFGDNSVGIPPSTAIIDLPYGNPDEHYGHSRNALRKEVKKFFEKTLYWELVSVVFSDECPDCGTVRGEGCSTCPNKNCISLE